MNPYVLVVYGASDHYGVLIRDYLLETSPIPVLALDYESPVSFCLDNATNDDWSIHFDGVKYGLPAAAWFRFKMVSPPRISNDVQAARNFRKTEWIAFLNGVGPLLGHRLLNGSAIATPKVYQQQLARMAGFKVARSGFFLGREAGGNFLASVGDAVTKAIGPQTVARFESNLIGDMIITTAVDPVSLQSADEDSLRVAPVWFQEQLKTGIEYRVIATIDQVFAACTRRRIEERRVVDGRFDPTEFQRAEASAETYQCIRQYLVLAQLDYGVFDIIENDNGVFFLECNVDGQWHSAIPHDIDQVVETMGQLILKRAEEVQARK